MRHQFPLCDKRPKAINASEVKYLSSKILIWGNQNIAKYPWRTTQNKWHAIAAEIMLQRTNADQVLPVFLSFRKAYKSPISYLNAGSPNIFVNLGLSWRIIVFRKLARILTTIPIPSKKDELLLLPGVGPYISSAYRSLHLGVRDYIIDANVVRLYGRFFGFGTNNETRRKKWFGELADIITPKYKFRAFNYGLIDFTRAICKPYPLCLKCALHNKCAFHRSAAG